MLQAPIYLYPENQTFDVSNSAKNKITFDFSGDYLSSVRYRITDYSTGNIVAEWDETSFNAADSNHYAYNRETISTPVQNIINGKDYVLQMMLTQSPNRLTKYDMLTLRGATRVDYIVNTADGKSIPSSEIFSETNKSVIVDTQTTDSGTTNVLKVVDNAGYGYKKIAVDYDDYYITAKISADATVVVNETEKDIKMIVCTNANDEIIYTTTLSAATTSQSDEYTTENYTYWFRIPQGTKNLYINSEVATVSLKENVRDEETWEIVANARNITLPYLDKMPTVYGRLPVEKGISNIYEWNMGDEWRTATTFDDDDTKFASSMAIDIKGETFVLDQYNEDEGFIVVVGFLKHNIPKGTPYVISSNYIVTPQYFFSTCATPDITGEKLKIVKRDESTQYALPFDIQFTANYTGFDTALIDYYTVELLTGDTIPHKTEATLLIENPSLEWKSIGKSDRIYSQKITSRFSKCILAPTTRDVQTGELVGRFYKAVLNVVFSNKMTMRKVAYAKLLPSKDETGVEWNLKAEIVARSERNARDDDGNNICGTMVVLSPENRRKVNGELCVTRLNRLAQEIVPVPSHDCTISQKAHYDYLGMFVFEVEDGYRFYADTKVIPVDIDLEGYTISELVRSEGDQVFTKTIYNVGETWRFEGEINGTTITNNTDRATHTGYSRYPVQTSTNVRYESGSVSAILGYVEHNNGYGAENEVETYEDNHYLIQQFRNFITKPSMFLLKSPKGDVWVVNITESSTEYDNYKNSPTKVNFNWVQCMDVNDIIIYKPLKIYRS